MTPDARDEAASATELELDQEPEKPDVDPVVYVDGLCKTADLRTLLRVENELINEIRGLDGERKALVYDNYSKLISATDTIKKVWVFPPLSLPSPLCSRLTHLTSTSPDAQLYGTTNPSDEHARTCNLPYRTDIDLSCIHYQEYPPLAPVRRPGGHYSDLTQEEDCKMGSFCARTGAALGKGRQDRRGAARMGCCYHLVGEMG